MSGSVISKEVNTKAILEAVNLTCIRSNKLIFEEVSFRLGKGDILQTRGPNGSGKTSLLRILCGFILPEEGEVNWNGRAISDDIDDYTKEINYVSHSNGIKSELTPFENLNVSRQLTYAQHETSIAKVISTMSLSEFADTPVHKLSSGQCRRVALSRLLLSRAPVWLLDEPFTTLDDSGRQLIQDLIALHSDSGGITVVVIHEPLRLPDRQILELTL